MYIFLYSSTNLLVSLRGVILSRETIVSDLSECPFPAIPKGQVFLPHYGLVSSSIPVDLSLGCCYLGNRSVVLTVRDVSTDDNVKMYLDFRNRAYPIGLVPGAVVSFYHLQQHISRKGVSSCVKLTIATTVQFIPPDLR